MTTLECPRCFQEFKNKGGLTRHLNRKNKCKEVFKCKKCSKLFDSKDEYLVHKEKCGNGVLSTGIYTREQYEQLKKQIDNTVCSDDDEDLNMGMYSPEQYEQLKKQIGQGNQIDEVKVDKMDEIEALDLNKIEELLNNSGINPINCKYQCNFCMEPFTKDNDLEEHQKSCDIMEKVMIHRNKYELLIQNLKGLKKQKKQLLKEKMLLEKQFNKKGTDNDNIIYIGEGDLDLVFENKDFHDKNSKLAEKKIYLMTVYTEYVILCSGSKWSVYNKKDIAKNLYNEQKITIQSQLKTFYKMLAEDQENMVCTNHLC